MSMVNRHCTARLYTILSNDVKYSQHDASLVVIDVHDVIDYVMQHVMVNQIRTKVQKITREQICCLAKGSQFLPDTDLRVYDTRVP